MKDNKWCTTVDETCFETAQQNMDYDEKLINGLPESSHILREYRWKSPGITYSYKQSCPSNLAHFDHAKRVTGGGIVFHSPGDIVFSISMWLNDPSFPGSLSKKLALIAEKIRTRLNINESIETTETSTIDRDRCSMYPTPFEIILDNKKILGLTIRRFKEKCLIQGVLHISNSDPLFKTFINPFENYQEVNITTKYILINA